MPRSFPLPVLKSPSEPRTDSINTHPARPPKRQGDTLTLRRRPCSDTNLVPVLTQTSTFNFDSKFSCFVVKFSCSDNEKRNEETVLPREVGRAATVVRCQVATPRPPCRCIANVLLRWSAQTAPRRKRAAVRGPRGSRFDAAQWAKREPGGSVRLEGCIQDGSLGYCATERVACAATAPLNVSHPGKRNTLSLQNNSNSE